MVNTSRELVNEMNEVMNLAIRNCFTFDALSNMSEAEIQAFRALNNIWKKSCDLLIKQAEVFEELDERNKRMERKLDELLSR